MSYDILQSIKQKCTVYKKKFSKSVPFQRILQCLMIRHDLFFRGGVNVQGVRPKVGLLNISNHKLVTDATGNKMSESTSTDSKLVKPKTSIDNILESSMNRNLS